MIHLPSAAAAAAVAAVFGASTEAASAYLDVVLHCCPDVHVSGWEGWGPDVFPFDDLWSLYYRIALALGTVTEARQGRKKDISIHVFVLFFFLFL